jgi:hypothetical protein
MFSTTGNREHWVKNNKSINWNGTSEMVTEGPLQETPQNKTKQNQNIANTQNTCITIA